MEVYAPTKLAEALELRAEHPEAVPVAGGTDLWVDLNFRRARPEALLDLSRLSELADWSREPELVFVGAGVTFARIARELSRVRPLAEAARSVGSPQIRNRATLGGNIGTASPAGDALPVLAAFDARIVVGSSRHTRTVAFYEFFVGPKRTSLAPDELILGVEWRLRQGPGSFAKVGPRNAMVIAVAGVCVQLDPLARAVTIALGSVGPTVLRSPAAEAFAAGVVPWDDPGAPVSRAALAELGRLAAVDARPIDDLRGTAAYRRHVVEILTRRVFAWTLDDRKDWPW
jgi:CO/xanthine dehydrogenase FAD-binding subunit